MATKAQIEANCANTPLGSGPVQEEGPAPSSHKAVENGLTGQTSRLRNQPPAAPQDRPPLPGRKVWKRVAPEIAPDDGYVKRCKECQAVMTDRRRTYCSAACTRLALTENSKFIVPPSVSPRASFVRNPYRRRWS
jgi:hypothetical protein